MARPATASRDSELPNTADDHYRFCMKVPPQLEPLVQDGIIDEVLRPLMTGKEAAVYVVLSHGVVRCAKVYKRVEERSFKARAAYQEGRRVQSSRRSRAMQRGSRYGKRELEADWQNAEVDALHRLTTAGVRVPEPLTFLHGVLIMELIMDAEGNAAPRLNDLTLSADTARRYYRALRQDVVKMLCAGLIHGDLSEYNVLVDADGPVIIDLPQAVDAAANNNASRMVLRDLDNLANYFGRFAPDEVATDYGREVWQLYEAGKLFADTELTGRFVHPTRKADVKSVLRDIDDARRDAEQRTARPALEPEKVEVWRGVIADEEEPEPTDRTVDRPPPPRRRVVELAPPKRTDTPPSDAPRKRRRRRGRGKRCLRNPCRRRFPPAA